MADRKHDFDPYFISFDLPAVYAEVDPESPLGQAIARLQKEIENPGDAVAGYSSAV